MEPQKNIIQLDKQLPYLRTDSPELITVDNISCRISSTKLEKGGLCQYITLYLRKVSPREEDIALLEITFLPSCFYVTFQANIGYKRGIMQQHLDEFIQLSTFEKLQEKGVNILDLDKYCRHCKTKKSFFEALKMFTRNDISYISGWLKVIGYYEHRYTEKLNFYTYRDIPNSPKFTFHFKEKVSIHSSLFQMNVTNIINGVQKRLLCHTGGSMFEIMPTKIEQRNNESGFYIILMLSLIPLKNNNKKVKTIKVTCDVKSAVNKKTDTEPEQTIFERNNTIREERKEMTCNIEVMIFDTLSPCVFNFDDHFSNALFFKRVLLSDS